MTTKEKAKRAAEEKIEIIKKIGFQTSPISEKPFNYESEVRSGKEKLKLQVYFGKKGVKTILQGGKDTQLYKDLADLLLDEVEFGFPGDIESEPNEYIGTDESGKGDLFGPLVTAAVLVNEETKNKLRKLGVKDSKELTDKQINELAPKIEAIVKPNLEIVKINPEKYNELYTKFRNLNKLLMWSHSRAIENLLKKVECKDVITDKFSNESYKFSDAGILKKVNFQQITKAEKYTGVAAASILARNRFNLWFTSKDISELKIPKGASKLADAKVAEIAALLGRDELNRYCKMHFKNLKKI